MIWVRVVGLFYESKLLGIEDINYPTFLREDSWEFRRCRIENWRRKVGNPV